MESQTDAANVYTGVYCVESSCWFVVSNGNLMEKHVKHGMKTTHFV